MVGAVDFWGKSLALCIVFFALGYITTAFFMDLFWLRLLGGMGMICIILGTFFLGGIAFIHGLEGGHIVHIKDGKREIIMTLCLGPFKYSRVIPEIKGIETGEATDK